MLADVRPRVIREPYSWQAGRHLFCLRQRPACVGPTRHMLSAPGYSPSLACLIFGPSIKMLCRHLIEDQLWKMSQPWPLDHCYNMSHIFQSL